VINCRYFTFSPLRDLHSTEGQATIVADPFLEGEVLERIHERPLAGAGTGDAMVTSASESSAHRCPVRSGRIVLQSLARRDHLLLATYNGEVIVENTVPLKTTYSHAPQGNTVRKSLGFTR